MRSGEKSHLNKFSDRLQSFYSNWRTHQSREWMGTKLIVFCSPSYQHRPDIDPDQDSLKFFEWLFGEWLDDVYIVLSPTEIYAVCRNIHSGSDDAKFLGSFAEVAKKRVGVDFVVKDKGSGRTLREALVEMAGGFRRSLPLSGVKEKHKEKKKVAVGFIGKEAPYDELAQWIEWKDVTDAFCRLAGFK